MEYLEENYRHIKGWGIDADPKNEPTYPMKKYTGDDHMRLQYERPPQQLVRTEILHSNERPWLTAVFGTSSPPTGLSGMLRRFAFRYSEGSFKHWLPLLLADRVNVVEGVVDDLTRGHVPNIFEEKGMKAEWRLRPERAAKRLLAGIVVTSVVLSVLLYPKKSRR